MALFALRLMLGPAMPSKDSTSLEGLLQRSDASAKGALLFFHLRCRVMGISIEAESYPAIEQHFGVSRSALRRVQGFAAALFEHPGSEVAICQGSSCRLNGAAAFHRELFELLGELGPQLVIGKYHCLSNCLDGPNIGIRNLLYSPCGESVQEVPQRQLEVRRRVEPNEADSASF